MQLEKFVSTCFKPFNHLPFTDTTHQQRINPPPHCFCTDQWPTQLEHGYFPKCI